MIDLRHTDPTKVAGRCNAEKYALMKAALLQVVPRASDGVAFGDLADLVQPLLPDRWGTGSVMWWVTTVKLDLEARGVIERVPKSAPQRLRKTTAT